METKREMQHQIFPTMVATGSGQILWWLAGAIVGALVNRGWFAGDGDDDYFCWLRAKR